MVTSVGTLLDTAVLTKPNASQIPDEELDAEAIMKEMEKNGVLTGKSVANRTFT